MKSPHDGETLSIWMSTVEMPFFRELQEDVEADVCVVGGGMGGLTTAYLLAKEGKNVCVLEDSVIGGGQTGKTTAQMVTALDRRYSELRKYHGDEGIRLAASSHREALRRIEDIVRTENIDCDLQRVNGYLFLSPDSDRHLLDDELEAAHTAGLEDVRFTEGFTFGDFQTGTCLCFPDQVQIHPLKYLRGLAERLTDMGVRIFTKSHAMAIKGGPDAFVQTEKGFSVNAKSVVVATNSPINNLFAIHTKQSPYRSYVVGYLIPKGSIPQGLFWDTAEPFHYVRVAAESDTHDALLVGGEDHKTGQNPDPRSCFTRLEKWTEERFPVQQRPFYRWSGQVMESIDGLAYLGRNPADDDNVYVITGDSGNGMTHCVIGAMLITDQIMGRNNPWEELYGPSRMHLRAAGNFLSENANVARQYLDWFRGDSPDSIEDIPAGEGRVIGQGLRKMAVYRNPKQELEFYSAICPHLGGVVHWNTVEKSWDCPCHGSRFDCHGKVIEGPALSSLSEISDEREAPAMTPLASI